jgi:hypothetical protein
MVESTFSLYMKVTGMAGDCLEEPAAAVESICLGKWIVLLLL